MDNDILGLQYEMIDKMTEDQLRVYINELNEAMNDPFDGGISNLHRDIALTLAMNRAKDRLNDFKRELLKI